MTLTSTKVREMGHSKEQKKVSGSEAGCLKTEILRELLSFLSPAHRFIMENFQTPIESTQKKLKLIPKPRTFFFVYF